MPSVGTLNEVGSHVNVMRLSTPPGVYTYDR